MKISSVFLVFFIFFAEVQPLSPAIKAEINKPQTNDDMLSYLEDREAMLNQDKDYIKIKLSF